MHFYSGSLKSKPNTILCCSLKLTFRCRIEYFQTNSFSSSKCIIVTFISHFLLICVVQTVCACTMDFVSACKLDSFIHSFIHNWSMNQHLKEWEPRVICHGFRMLSPAFMVVSVTCRHYGELYYRKTMFIFACNFALLGNSNSTVI